MKVTKLYYINITVDGEPSVAPSPTMEGSDGVWFQCTDTMPDGTEFGIQMNVIPAVEEIPVAFERQAERALDDYRRNHGGN